MAQPVLMVNLQPGRSNTGLLQVADGLAARLSASVIGIAAWQPIPIDWTGGDYVISNFTARESAATEAVMSGAEAEFRMAFPGPDVERRSSLSFAPPSRYIVEQVRHADLVLTGMAPDDGSDAACTVAADLVMQCGRPVLVVPATPASSSLDRVMLAWKDTREARRAALDALPLLRRAAHVTVVAVSADENSARARQSLKDVSHWLAGRGVVAEVQAVASGNNDAQELELLARSLDADLVVAGTYGHSRLREWAFGGVTRTLLQGNCCALLSH